jgi:hypothetical protein
MITIQKGSWRRGKDGKYKPFIQGYAQLNGTIVDEKPDIKERLISMEDLEKALGLNPWD